MTLQELEAEFANLPENYKTKDVDRLNKRLIKQKKEVSFLKDIVLERQEFYRTYFQVQLGGLTDIEEKFAFIEENFELLQDWWHVDMLSQFVDKKLTFEFAYPKAKEYINSPMPYVRRWAYVMFMPTLVKLPEAFDAIIKLFRDDEVYHVQMAEAWLISYLGIYEPEKTLDYLAGCPLKYNIAGKAIQKICDSYRVSSETKESFKAIRKNYQ